MVPSCRYCVLLLPSRHEHLSRRMSYELWSILALDGGDAGGEGTWSGDMTIV